ncbi:hypothetical protein ACUXQ2_005721 [Cupriavidus metallidurans]
MKTIKNTLFASVLLASLGATSGVVIAAQKLDPFHDGARTTDMRDRFTGARSVTDPRDPFTDGGRSATGQADSGLLAAGVRKPDPFTDGARSVTDPRDPFTDGGRSATGQADSGLLAAGARKPDPFTDGARSVTDPRDPFTDGGHVAPVIASAPIA